MHFLFRYTHDAENTKYEKQRTSFSSSPRTLLEFVAIGRDLVQKALAEVENKTKHPNQNVIHLIDNNKSNLVSTDIK